MEHVRRERGGLEHERGLELERREKSERRERGLPHPVSILLIEKARCGARGEKMKR